MKILRRLGLAWDQLQAFYCRYLGRDYTCGCGHTAKRKTSLTIDGRSGVFTVPRQAPPYCPQCWAEAAIKCAWCGDIIVPGDPITLYSPGKPAGLFFSTKEPSEAQQRRKQEDFVVPEYAVVYQREPRLVLVGCLGWDCADVITDRAGFWVMPGKVQRAISPEEMLMALGGDAALIVK